MKDPRRLIDDENAAPELRELLRGAAPRRGMDPAARARGRSALGRMTGASVTVAAWLGWKSAFAAIGLTAGAATAVALEQIVASRLEAEAPALPAPEVPTRAPSTGAPSLPGPVRPEAIPLPAETPTAALPPVSPSSARAPMTDELGEETRLLESARRLLGSSPDRALALTREHQRRFARPELEIERTLIEVEALSRVGRLAEARALGERLLAAGPGGLYEARIRRLLEKMGGASLPVKERGRAGD